MHHWGNNPSVIGNLHLFVVYEKKCICITAHCAHQIPACESNQEEAYFGILLHVKHISQSISNVIIHTPKTDVFVIGIPASTELATSVST